MPDSGMERQSSSQPGAATLDPNVSLCVVVRETDSPVQWHAARSTLEPRLTALALLVAHHAPPCRVLFESPCSWRNRDRLVGCGEWRNVGM